MKSDEELKKEFMGWIQKEVLGDKKFLNIYFKSWEIGFKQGEQQATEKILKKVDYLISKTYNEGENIDKLWVEWNLFLKELKQWNLLLKEPKQKIRSKK